MNYPPSYQHYPAPPPGSIKYQPGQQQQWQRQQPAEGAGASQSQQYQRPQRPATYWSVPPHNNYPGQQEAQFYSEPRLYPPLHTSVYYEAPPQAHVGAYPEQQHPQSVQPTQVLNAVAETETPENRHRKTIGDYFFGATDDALGLGLGGTAKSIRQPQRKRSSAYAHYSVLAVAHLLPRIRAAPGHCATLMVRDARSHQVLYESGEVTKGSSVHWPRFEFGCNPASKLVFWVVFKRCRSREVGMCVAQSTSISAAVINNRTLTLKLHRPPRAGNAGRLNLTIRNAKWPHHSQNMTGE